MLISYHTTFVPLVTTGRKLCTIRTRAPRPGETLHHYTGPYRPGQRRRIAITICTSVHPISIHAGRVTLDQIPLTPAEVETLAREDGFPDAIAFHTYFGRRPFFGYLIRWSSPAAPGHEPSTSPTFRPAADRPHSAPS